ncbi:gamma-glutamyl-gamma-aminobutyraldehyde dehydrogenase [Glaciecola punicea ACAM 611]|jgi:gamma-glutamyl-gamma-aminobutyraldehyde dehydrogenase|uniref:Gamma-glutamyl-gamma-aminobutyraldehyde dehydrogenase n=1 Tax=Glaciecola punicea ACAM 611 TaxID=1121923 RepID=H5TCJ0_9ALTE|nr:aldehyde dehydrogenase family protein [Glaciecola punicea]GAB56017.1 gamma-glutamyl-gamma-aminobutyraldehyde dehydrogenase [Glaciecola punicea ACAM 611]
MLTETMTNVAPENLSHDDWVNLADNLKIETELFIDGSCVAAASGARFETINPATGKVLASVACGGVEDINLAVAAAKRAWEDGRWKNLPTRERITILLRFADLVETHAAELALLESLDMGKPITDALTIDLPEVVVSLRYFAECIDKINGAVTNTDNNALHMILREPLGVVGAISAWNYPLLMAVWKVAPALAAGNCVVLKPSENAPLSCIKLAQLFVKAGGPAGVFNVVNGYGQEAGKALALHMDVAKISFTGSTAVGKQLMIYAAQSNLKRVALETGGKSPQIFMSDLEDIDRAVDYAFAGIFDNAGQVCNAGSRLLVHRDIYDVFIEKFTQRSQAVYQHGEPLNPATTLGPVVTHLHQKNVLAKIEQGIKEGAKLVFGGRASSAFEQGAYVQPTLLSNVESHMTIAQDEIFGPVAVAIRFDDEQHALAIANDSIFGLAASVWTADLKTAHRMIKGIEAGVVWVNCFGDGDMTQPFGGYKQSGNTRDKSIECFIGYTQSKSAWINLD